MPLTYERWHTLLNTRFEAYFLEDQSELVKRQNGSYCMSDTFKKESHSNNNNGECDAQLP